MVLGQSPNAQSLLCVRPHPLPHPTSPHAPSLQPYLGALSYPVLTQPPVFLSRAQGLGQTLSLQPANWSGPRASPPGSGPHTPLHLLSTISPAGQKAQEGRAHPTWTPLPAQAGMQKTRLPSDQSPREATFSTGRAGTCFLRKEHLQQRGICSTTQPRKALVPNALRRPFLLLSPLVHNTRLSPYRTSPDALKGNEAIISPGKRETPTVRKSRSPVLPLKRKIWARKNWGQRKVSA